MFIIKYLKIHTIRFGKKGTALFILRYSNGIFGIIVFWQRAFVQTILQYNLNFKFWNLDKFAFPVLEAIRFMNF